MEKQLKEKEKWIALRRGLNNNYNYSDAWSNAISIFDKRINEKYLFPIQNLIYQDIRKGEGFVIVTIQCALIESFAAFKEGLIHNHSKPNNGGCIFEYKDSRDLFIRFLNTESIFEGIFFTIYKNGEKQNNVPFSAPQFYSQVRCGLMHEARTKGCWHINATKKDDINDEKFIKQKTKGNVIYRTLLHAALIRYFEEYKKNLSNPEDEYNELRRLFGRKLDHLYDIKDEFDWWHNN